MEGSARPVAWLCCATLTGIVVIGPAQGATAPSKVDLSERLLTAAEAQSITGFTGTLVDGASTATRTSWRQVFNDRATGQQKFAVSIWLYARKKAQTPRQLLASVDDQMPQGVAGMRCQVVEKVPPKVTKVCWNQDVMYAVALRKFESTGVSGTSVQRLGQVPNPANPGQSIVLEATEALKEKVVRDAQWLRDDQKQKALTGSV